MHYTVEIETTQRPFRAVARITLGPRWVRRLRCAGDNRSDAFVDLCTLVAQVYAQHTFTFIHTPA